MRCEKCHIDIDELFQKHLQYFLDARGVENPCDSCNGLGVKSYSDTSTWRGGIGGQMFTSDVCDSCWGTGDKFKKGVNLKKYLADMKKLINEDL